jgi:hypothetical protein
MLLSIPCLALASALAMAAPPDSSEGGWTPLFNGKNLDGWYTFLQEHGRDSDPDGIITIEDGAIHLYKNVEDKAKVVMGYIGTEQEHGDYHLRLQYRWGDKKFEPRYALKKDAGLYYHITGPDVVWPRSLQYQIEETNVGDLIALFGMQLDTAIDPKTRDAKSPDYPTFLPVDRGGEPKVLGLKGIDYQHRLAEVPERDGWNDVEIICKGAEVTHLLNGKVVNHGTAVRFDDPAKPGDPKPLTKGRIALEIEAAEIWFRNVEIRPAP